MNHLDTEFALHLLGALDAKLVTARRLQTWASHLPEEQAAPWIASLRSVTSDREATQIVSDYVYEIRKANKPNRAAHEPAFDTELVHLSCLFRRYARRELSWATFLELAGRHCDEAGGQTPCETYFAMLSEFEDDDFSLKLEQSQVGAVREALANSLDESADQLGPVLNVATS